MLASNPADSAYKALGEKRYDEAIVLFSQAVERTPDNAALRKDLAYTYLKTGDNDSARHQFAEAFRLNPADEHAALEYAFLSFEAGAKAEARRVFDRVRKSPGKETRDTAERAFQNIDGALAEGIARWQAAVQLDPENFSAHRELAELSEERDDLPTAAEHYLRAWRLKPQQRSLMLALGRVWQRMDREADALAVLLAAARGAEPRVAEAARELLPERYPYVYEFRQALALDPDNVNLHRELAYLLLAMKDGAGAEREFAAVLRHAPDDLLSAAQLGFLMLARNDTAAALPLLERVMAGPDKELADRARFMLNRPREMRQTSEAPRTKVSEEAKAFAERSFQKGYMNDALKYYAIAHDKDPLDFDVMLKLAWTHNVMGHDDAALPWFALARRAPEAQVAAEAERAWRGLNSESRHLRLSTWMLPMYSSRWRDAFAYGQVKAEWRAGKFPIRPYISTRIVGDTKGMTNASLPMFLSENSIIFAGGLNTKPWKGILAWGEAGTAMGYRTGKFLPDYRGGISQSRRFGRRVFHATENDVVFISRFDKDTLVYSQNRTGIKVSRMELFWHANLTVDAKRQAWANYAETGPGVAVRLPTNVRLTVSLLRGAYLVPQDNVRSANFWDIRAGLWYAFTY